MFILEKSEKTNIRGTLSTDHIANAGSTTRSRSSPRPNGKGGTDPFTGVERTRKNKTPWSYHLQRKNRECWQALGRERGIRGHAKSTGGKNQGLNYF